MSTYNGGAYLDDQIKSLLNQQYQGNISIVVRDDGSKDSTKDILKKYAELGILSYYYGNNIGWAKSFMDLVSHAPASDYYAFCDQDDIWLPEKINRALDQLSCFNKLPCLYFSNLLYWKDGNIEGSVKKEIPSFNQYNCLLQCPSYGCTMVFNSSLMLLLKSHLPSKVYAHDFWVFQVAVLMGKVIYDNNAYILYRQHSGNQIGAKRSKKDIWNRRKKHLLHLWHDHEREEMAQQLYLLFANEMSEKNLEVVEVVANYRKNFINYLKLLFSRKYVMNKFSNTVWLKLRILIRKF